MQPLMTVTTYSREELTESSFCRQGEGAGKGFLIGGKSMPVPAFLGIVIIPTCESNIQH